MLLPVEVTLFSAREFSTRDVWPRAASGTPTVSWMHAAAAVYIVNAAPHAHDTAAAYRDGCRAPRLQG